jgi:hypothetical protein
MLLQLTAVGNDPTDLEVVQKTWSPSMYRPCTFWSLVIKDSTDCRIAKLVACYKLWNRDSSIVDKLAYRLLVFGKDFKAWKVLWHWRCRSHNYLIHGRVKIEVIAICSLKEPVEHRLLIPGLLRALDRS